MLRRRFVLVVVSLLFGLIASAWLGWTALQARDHLEEARAALPAIGQAVTSGEPADAEGGLARLAADASAAYDKTHDPVWAAAAWIPWLGQPLATVRGLTEAVDELASTSLPALSSVAADITPAALRPAPDQINVDKLRTAAGPLSVAADSLATERTEVADLRPSWLPQVADARSQLLEQLTPLAKTARNASLAAELLPPMLGADGPRSYFVGFQNPAEARGTGGLLGAYAVLAADRGRVSVSRLGANTALPELPEKIPGLNEEFAARYAAQGGVDLWVNANLSPDFPEVAQTWLAMWQAGTGQALDGALAVDPKVLAALVRATGPLEVAGVGTISAEQVEPLVLRDQYLLTDVVASRKEAMVGVGQAAVDALLGGRADPERLVDEFAALGAGHVFVSSTRSEEQALLRRAGITGAVSETNGPFAQAVVVNAAGGKLDSYLDSSLDYRVTECSDDGRTVVITVSLTNAAPPSGLPDYVVLRADDPPFPTVPGQNRLDLRVLATSGAQLAGAELDSKPLLAPIAGTLPDVLPAGSAEAFLSQTTQVGRPSFGLALELLPGQTRTLELTLEEPPTQAAPELPVQTMARTTAVTADVSACG